MSGNLQSLRGVNAHMRRLLVIAALALGTSACFGRGGAASPARRSAPRIEPATLGVDVTLVPPCSTGDLRGGCIVDHITRHYTLRCDPTGGTMPAPAVACHALADLYRRMHSPRWRLLQCMGAPEVTSTAILHGSVGGRRFTINLDASDSWCDQPVAVMHDLWALSTFPCAYPVLHTGGSRGRTPLEWARHNGCPVRNGLPQVLTTER